MGAGGYPSHPEYLEFHRTSANGIRLWAIGGAPWDPDAAARRAEHDAARFVERVAARLREFEMARGRKGLVTFAIDTELLGHWWTEGPLWLDAVLRLAQRHGIRPLTLERAAERHEGEERRCATRAGGTARASTRGTRRLSPTSHGRHAGSSCGSSAP